jgi:UDP-3-O-[3-hydroxymyristoyl] glucosamine N-acyltransferase
VPNDVPPGAVVASGVPAFEIRAYRRIVAAWIRLPEILRRLRAVERRLGIRSDTSD